jgi:hypothetical protein
MKTLQDAKIYLHAGGDESDTMIEHVKSFKDRALQMNCVKIK